MSKVLTAKIVASEYLGSEIASPELQVIRKIAVTRLDYRY